MLKLVRVTAPAALAAVACMAPAAHADTTLTTCTPSDYDAAVAAGGTVTFAVDCPNLVPSVPVSVPAGKVLDVEGNGHNVALNGGGKRRLFTVSGGSLTVRGVTIKSGAAAPAASANGARGANGTNGTVGTNGAPGSAGGAGGNGGPGSPGTNGKAG